VKAPPITPAQIIAAIAAILGLLVSLTVIDDETSKAILAAASTLVPIVYVIADALIRNGQARAIAAGAQLVNGVLYSPNADPRQTATPGLDLDVPWTTRVGGTIGLVLVWGGALALLALLALGVVLLWNVAL
jgi:hypothetical protein